MNTPADEIPTDPARTPATRMVRVGGMGKGELLSELRAKGVELNDAGRELFADSRFATSDVSAEMATVELSVAGLGYPRGATHPEILERAAELGLALCPLELAPHLRLQYLDQPEGANGYPGSLHRAPPGSVTIASARNPGDEETPVGFYLRRINGVLWLRGFRCAPEHVWSPEDRFVFCSEGRSRSLRVTLREITSETVRAVTKLAVRPDQAGFVAPNAVSLSEALFSDEAWYRAIYADDALVGFVMLSDESLKDTPPAEPNIGLWRFMIDAEYQRRGIGSEAIRCVLEHVRNRPGIRSFYTSYVDEPGGPGPFYLGLGFEPNGEVDDGEVVAVYPLHRSVG